MKGSVRLMGFKCPLRYSSRRYGNNYKKAAEMLTDLHGTVGMPLEAKEEIREELNQVTSMIRDEALKPEMKEEIPGSVAEEADDEAEPPIPENLIFFAEVTNKSGLAMGTSSLGKGN